MNKFQTILLTICGAALLLAVLAFAGYIPTPKSKKDALKGSGKVVVWGTKDNENFVKFMDDLAAIIPEYTLTYVPKNEDTYIRDLIEAFADGNAPDIFFVDEKSFIRLQDKIAPIPYTSYPKSNFINSYTPAASLFLGKDGVYAMPLLVDPLVMYYNRTLLASSGIVNPPLYWDEFIGMANILNKRDTLGNFLQSMLPFGRFENNPYAKDIISLLLIQLNNPLVYKDSNDTYRTNVHTHENQGKLTLPPVIEFFTDFSSPEKVVYSWNKSLLNATTAFLREELVFHIAPASELFSIRELNPNLAFGVAEVPSPRGTKSQYNYASITGLAVSKQSKNQYTSFLAAQTIASKDNAKLIANAFSLPPVYVENLNKDIDPSLEYSVIFNKSALKSYTWADPDRLTTNSIFRDLSQAVLAGGFSVDGAYERAGGSLGLILENYNQSIQAKKAPATDGNNSDITNITNQ
jgi:ABC-type glycerol-3-phosphate transport system substrate-binding protein